jgi:hypothetical protein
VQGFKGLGQFFGRGRHDVSQLGSCAVLKLGYSVVSHLGYAVEDFLGFCASGWGVMATEISNRTRLRHLHCHRYLHHRRRRHHRYQSLRSDDEGVLS